MRALLGHPTDHMRPCMSLFCLLAAPRQALVPQTRKPGVVHLPLVQLAGLRGSDARWAAFAQAQGLPHVVQLVSLKGTGAPWQPLHRFKSSPPNRAGWRAAMWRRSRCTRASSRRRWGATSARRPARGPVGCSAGWARTG